MKVHYINMLLFALPLNILVNTHKEPFITSHTPKITNTRLLCECELYAPANYDSDPQMKKVMDNFNKQTEQRFHEYDERMKTTRQKCKDKCDKEIQKIILKDKLEKQMEEQLTTLETKIDIDDIPTCICEKSMADKMEKGCLRCGGVFGGIAPSVGILGGIGEAAISVLKPLALKAATEEAIAEATAVATQAGVDAVVSKLKQLLTHYINEFYVDLPRIVTPSNYKCGTALVQTAEEVFGKACKIPGGTSDYSFCTTTIYSRSGEYYLGNIANIGATTYDATLTTETASLKATKLGAVKATYAGYHTSIIASIVAIVVIILIVVIIYMILRYRRKKKMKKKLQYIKLLKE